MANTLDIILEKLVNLNGSEELHLANDKEYFTTCGLIIGYIRDLIENKDDILNKEQKLKEINDISLVIDPLSVECKVDEVFKNNTTVIDTINEYEILRQLMLGYLLFDIEKANTLDKNVFTNGLFNSQKLKSLKMKTRHNTK